MAAAILHYVERRSQARELCGPAIPRVSGCLAKGNAIEDDHNPTSLGGQLSIKPDNSSLGKPGATNEWKRYFGGIRTDDAAYGLADSS